MLSTSSAFTLKLLTGFTLQRDGQEIDIPGQKSRALFCILAVQLGKPLARSALSELLWDGMAPEQAATNLRQTISVIKRALEEDFSDLLDVTKQTIGLQASRISIDIVSSDLIDALPPQDLQLFGGMGVKSRRFEMWLEEQQNRIVAGTISRNQRALGQAIDMGRQDTALELALRLHELEPDDEANARVVHRLLRALGQNHRAAGFAKDNPDISFEPAIHNASPAAVDESISPAILIGRFNCNPDDRAASAIAITLTEAIVGDLAESAWVRVMAPDLTNLSAPMFGLTQHQSNSARWNYRLDGAIQSSPLTASVWLTSGVDQTVVWTEKFEGQSVGALADNIVSRVTASLESVVLDAEGKRATHARTIAGYWEDIARARLLFWRASQTANQEAEALLDQMLEDAPHDVRVLTLATYAKLMNAWSGWQGSATINLDQAVKLSRRAIQSVPDDAWSLMTMATVLSARLDLVGAKRKLEQAIAIRPYLTAAKGEMARVLVFSGQTKQGRILAAEALDASPRDPHASLWLRTQAIASWMEGNFTHAADMAQLAIEKRSNWYPNYLICAVALMRAGDQSASEKAIQSAQELGSNALSADALRCGHPFEDRLIFDQFINDLRAAGWTNS